MRDAQTVLDETGILAASTPDEVCIVIVPSAKIKSGQIALLLKNNGIELRTLGRGSGLIYSASNWPVRVRNLLIVAVKRKHAKLAGLYAKLFGSAAAVVACSGAPVSADRY